MVSKETFNHNEDSKKSTPESLKKEVNHNEDLREGYASFSSLQEAERVIDGEAATYEERAEEAGVNEQEKQQLKEASRDASEKIEAEKIRVVAESLDMSVDAVKQQVEDTAKFLADREAASGKDLAKEFLVDPAVAELYVELAQSSETSVEEQAEKIRVVAESLDMSVDAVKQQVEDTAKFLADREAASGKDLAKEFLVDPAVAELYVELAQSS